MYFFEDYTLWSAFTYAVRLLCLCEIVPLKSYLGAGAAGAVFSHTAYKLKKQVEQSGEFISIK